MCLPNAESLHGEVIADPAPQDKVLSQDYAVEADSKTVDVYVQIYQKQLAAASFL